MKYAITALILSALLSACSPTLSDEKIISSTAPDIINYTPEQLKKVAAEMSSGQCAMSNEFIIDYGVMRDQARILKGNKVDVKR